MSTPCRHLGDCGSALPDAAAASTVQPAAAGAWRRRHWPMALWSLAAVAVGMPATATAAPAALGDLVTLPDLPLLDGGTLTAGALRDTAVVLVFFTTTCTFCRRHNARLEQLAQATRGQPLRVIGVAGDGDAARVRDYVRQQGWRFAVTLGAEPLRASLTARRVVPLTCVLDRAARLREVIPGEMSEPDVLGLARWARVA
jgi:thiol-disulfide isomerase/thioredoxin